MSLSEGQYKIGNTVFGSRTMYPVSSFESNSYQINGQDFQVTNTDEMRFGMDTFSPGTMSFTMAAIDNRILPSMAGYTGISPVSILSGSTLLERLAREWRADEIRSMWNAQKPLLICRAGVTHRVYGRPRKFTSGGKTMKSEWIDIVCDFQRADTLSYSDEEFAIEVLPSGSGTTTQTITRTDGEGPSWIRLLIVGPINNPVIKIGPHIVQISTNLAAGKLIELSAYPWDRRIVNSDGLNLSASLIGASPYLDQLAFPAHTSWAIGLAGGSTTIATKMFILWRNAYTLL